MQNASILTLNQNTMLVIKVIEILADSPKSWGGCCP